MAGIFKIIVILVLAAALLGGSAFFANKLYFQPQKLDRLEKEELARKAELAAQPPPVDFTIAIYEKLAETTDPLARRAALLDFLQQYPDSTRLAEARARLGETNADLLFSSEPTPDKESYTVQKGDALVKIASKTQSNAELLMRANNLLTHNLQIGQVLLVPKFTPRILINPKAKTLTLLNGDTFFKEYAFESSGPPSAQITRIGDKIAMKDNKRVAFGSKEYVDADRSLILSPGGQVIRAKSEVLSGIMLPREDLEEIYTVVNIGTPIEVVK